MKEFTILEVLDAMEKNGYQKAIGAWVKRDYDKIISACAFGQAGLNLNVNPNNLAASVGRVSPKLQRDVINLNDKTVTEVPEIARQMKTRYSDRFLNRKIKVY